MKVPPSDVTALNPVVGGDIEFNFTDNPDWRSKVTGIFGNHDSNRHGFATPDFIISTPGALSIDSYFTVYLYTGVYTITIEATGYEDKVLMVTVQ